MKANESRGLFLQKDHDNCHGVTRHNIGNYWLDYGWRRALPLLGRRNFHRLVKAVLAIVILIGISLNPVDASAWTSRTSGTSSNLTGVAFGNGVFVAVGDAGTILTSGDGVSWTPRTSPNTNFLRAVTYGGGQFVAVGGGDATTGPRTILTSSDGVTWTSRVPAGGSRLFSVAYGNGTYVAVGDGSFNIIASHDAVAWTAYPTSPLANVRGVCFGGGKFVAVGLSAAVLTSQDGQTWASGVSNGSNAKITFANGIFCSVGGGGGWIQTSSDALNWTRQTSGTVNALGGVLFAGKNFIACGIGGTILESHDAVLWASVLTEATNDLSGIAYGNGTFVIVGSAGTILQSTLADTFPIISNIDPNSATGSTSPMTFTINGLDFTNGAKVQVAYASNGYSFVNTNTDATFVSSTRLTVPITTTTQADTWKVRVLNADGHSVSNYVTLTVNPAPTNLGPFTLSNQTPYWDPNPPAGPAVRLNWTASNGARNYDVYRNGSLYSSGVPGTTFLNNLNLVGGQTYSYYVAAKDSNGARLSNTIQITMPTASQTSSAKVTGLMITGPSSIAAGSSASYTATAQYSDATRRDVTSSASFTLVQGEPSYATIGGSTLIVSRNAPVAALSLRAQYGNGASQVSSAAFGVIIASKFSASFTGVSQYSGGATHAITLDGSASGGIGPYTFRWDTNNNGAYDDKIGQHTSFNITSSGDTYLVRLEVTDATGAKAYSSNSLVVNKPLETNEPQWVNPTSGVGTGKMLDATGGDFQFSQNRINNGFIVLTHGIYSNGTESWIEDMASRIPERLGANSPNVAIYDWGQDSDPGGKVDPLKLKILAQLDKLLAINRVLLTLGLPGIGQLSAEASDFMIDCWYVRNELPSPLGQDMANWIWLQAKHGLINPDKPLQLVGHSAGGFVIGDCALWLRQHAVPLSGGKKVVVDRVTMLDTPFPKRPHLTTLLQSPGQPVVERILSSFYGGLEWDTWLIWPGSNYQIFNLGDYWSFRYAFDDTGHGLSYRWFNRTIFQHDEPDGATLDGYGSGGFNLSPFLGGYMVPRGSNFLSQASEIKSSITATSQLVIDQSLNGFSTFGNVSQQNGVYTLTEQLNAGLVLHNLTIPTGARTLKFRFMFTVPGDGDFINVRFGEGNNLFTGLDDELSRDGFTNIEVPLDGINSKTGDLVITLVSRGAANAVAQVADLAISVDDDPDADGLTTAQEQAIGSDPLNPDTDNDGWSDGYEVNVSHTNPLLADTDNDGVPDQLEALAGTNPNDSTSIFKVKDITKGVDGSVTLRWNGLTGKTYRVVRSTTPSFTAFDVIATKVFGTTPLTSYTDPATSLQGLPAAFYRVEVEQ